MQMTIGEFEYVTMKPMDAFTQLKVARRLAPAVPVLQGLISDENKEKDKRIITTILFSRVEEDDMMFIINKCLSTLGRKQLNDQLAPIFKNETLMFDDISMESMLLLSIEVIEENLGDFFRTALSALK